MSTNGSKISKKTPYSSKLKFLGDGSYGDVHTIRLNKTGETLALKRNYVNENISFIGSVVEMDILTKFKNYPNIINLKSIYTKNPIKRGNFNTPPNSRIDHVFFAMELGEKDGFNVMVDGRISLKTRKKIILDLLLGLEQLHLFNIIHRDVKPSNFIQTRDDNGVKRYKWCDFGMSHYYSAGEIAETKGIVTCSFRPPEIILGNKNYDFKSDVWSMGCLIIELLSKGQKTFLGKYDVEGTKNKILIKYILKRLCYEPDEETIKRMDVNNLIDFNYKNNRRTNIKRIIGLKKTDITNFNKESGSYEQLLDLISRMLIFDPKKRLNITEVLDHPYFNSNKILIINNRLMCAPKPIFVYLFKNTIRKSTAYIIKDNKIIDNDRWYPERVTFHALRIFDRFLYYNRDNLPRNKDMGLYQQVCIYLALKLFVAHRILTTFADFFKIKLSSGLKKLLIRMELHIISDVMCSNLYEPTLLEIADFQGDQLTKKQKWKLYELYVSLNQTGKIDLRQLYKKFRPKLGLK